MAVIKKCIGCGKEYASFPSTKRKYCSKSCSLRHHKGKFHPRYNGGLEIINKKCKFCKKDFSITKRVDKLRPAKYCSRKCVSNARLKPFSQNSYRYLYINGKRFAEHRLIMEKYLGRKLKKTEHIHHKNGFIRDNRIKNMRIVSNSEHTKLHKRGENSPNYKDGRSLVGKKCIDCGKSIRWQSTRCKKCYHISRRI